MKSQNQRQSFGSVMMMAAFATAIGVAGAASSARGDQSTSSSARPSSADREKFHAAMEACASETGVTHVRGERPSDADRAKMDTCLASKGITKPPGPPPGDRGGRPPGPPPEGSAS